MLLSNLLQNLIPSCYQNHYFDSGLVSKKDLALKGSTFFAQVLPLNFRALRSFRILLIWKKLGEVRKNV
jgi:hypothetical protein